MEDANAAMVVYEGLGGPGPDGRAMPYLASSWDIAPDKMSITFHLRKGIQFHEGWGEFTSADVKFSYEGEISPDSIQGKKSTWVEAIDSIETPDPYTAVVKLKIPNVDIISEFVQQTEDSPILCKKYCDSVGLDKAALHPIGTGPYHLIDSQAGNFLKFEAVPNHYRVVPEFQYLVMKLVPEETTRISMLKAGQIDATAISAVNKPELAAAGFKVESQGGGAHSFIVFGNVKLPEDPRFVQGKTNTDPWMDVRVRQAMNISIDRKAINDTFEAGTGILYYALAMLPGYQDVAPYEYNVAKAKQLLTEAGYPDGFSFEIESSPYHPGVPQVAKEVEAIVGMWAEIGIKAKIISQDMMSYFPIIIAGEDFHQCYSSRYTFEANPWTYMRCLLPDMGPSSYEGGGTAENGGIALRDLANKVLTTLDLDARVPLYKQVNQIFRDNYLSVPIVVVPYLFASNPKVVGNWPRSTSSYYYNYEYAQHATPLNTFQLYPFK